MTNRVAVVLAPGFEEMEALVPANLLRRAEIAVDLVGLEKEITGARGITIVADKLIDENLADYELIVIPGGQPGANNLKGNKTVVQSLKTAFERGNKIASICAGPIVLDEAGLLEGKNFVSFPGTEDDIKAGTRLADAIVVKDGQLITARGAGAAFEFGLALIDWLGKNAEKISESTQHQNVITQLKNK